MSMTVPVAIQEQQSVSAPDGPNGAMAPRGLSSLPTLSDFALAQSLNAARHASALRPFRSDEFGTGQGSPSAAHIRAANGLMEQMRLRLARAARQVERVGHSATRRPHSGTLQLLVTRKQQAGDLVKSTERVWAFYFELFGQRQSRFVDWLFAADRIALECYQAVYTGLSTHRSIPSPGPFCCVETDLTPSTFRRGVPLRRLDERDNPFPIVQLPFHRLVNPWTLGAIHHEVSHNLQSDLGLWEIVPRQIHRRLWAVGFPPMVCATWARWHKEIWADLSALLLGGPAIVASLIDVVALSPLSTMTFNSQGVHPTPYLRVLISVELLRRMGFVAEANAYSRLWQGLYPTPESATMPRHITETFWQANALVVDTICFQPYQELGAKSLADLVCFQPAHQDMAREAAGRMADGTDPGIIPARFLVGAARWAMDHRLAPPQQIARNFYRSLVRR